jgi:hypothetical protein
MDLQRNVSGIVVAVVLPHSSPRLERKHGKESESDMLGGDLEFGELQQEGLDSGDPLYVGEIRS